MTADVTVEPFPLAVPEATLDDLRRRLDAARLPERETVAGPGGAASWDQGVPLAHLQELCEHWRHAYDWRRVERELNAAGSSRAVVDGLGVHLLHARSPRPGARPLLLTHGWPGSVVEFLDVLGELTSPSDPHAPAFHVVAPSLPGFGFSDKPGATGWGVPRTADAWADLMTALGYPLFLAQGGDWGALVTTELAVRHPERVAGIHLTFPQADPPAGWRDDALDEREAAALAATRAFWRGRTAYARVQATSPQTLGYGLVDSPVALLPWIAEKLHEWTDRRGQPGGAVDRDRLLDDVMLHWLGASGASSARLYWESYGQLDRTTPVLVPTAVSVFPGEIERVPRAWVAARYRQLHRWTVLDRGGHFPSLEVPDLFLAEVRAAFPT